MGRVQFDDESTKRAQAVFGSVLGSYVGDYSCMYSLQSGVLYVGMTSVGFRSSCFGRERKITIPLVDVSDIKPYDGGAADGIVVDTVTGDEFVFRSFKDRDLVLKRLKDVRYTALTTVPEEGKAEEVLPAAKPDLSLRRVASESDLTPKKPRPDYDAEDGDELSKALASISDLSTSIRQQVQLETEEGEQRSSSSQRKPRPGGLKDSRTKSTRFFSMIAKKKSAEDYEEEWKKLRSSKDKIINDVAFSDVSINCDFDTFYTNFWSTAAAHPISEYQTDVVGDSEIKTSEWEVAPDGFTMERKIDYLHPSTAPMGPPEARTTKEQSLQKYASYGLMLHTTTKVDDVPMADCFVLEDRMFVEPNSGGSGVLLTAQTGIRFVKSTMWKKVIQSNSKKGIQQWLTGYSEFLTEKTG